MTDARLIGLLLAVAIGVSACGGGGGGGGPPPPPPVPVAVTSAWDANRETGVNSAGGGYQVSISGQPTQDVPYTSGSAAPTSTKVTLLPGSYTVTVRAYASLDPQGGNTGNFSAISQAIVNVP
jgi:hypothetical protein